MRMRTINRIAEAAKRARSKHPTFGREDVIKTLDEEVQEFKDEFKGSHVWTLIADEEALDVIAVLVRWLEEDE